MHVSVGTMRHLIVEACVARKLLSTSAYFWLGPGRSVETSIPAAPSQPSPWSAFMDGAPLSGPLRSAMMLHPAGRYSTHILVSTMTDQIVTYVHAQKSNPELTYRLKSTLLRSETSKNLSEHELCMLLVSRWCFMYESVAELEKIYKTAIIGPEEERAAAASILCGASLIRSWTVQVRKFTFSFLVLVFNRGLNYE